MRAFWIGICVALLGLGHDLPVPLRPAHLALGAGDSTSPVHWWVADRTGGQVVGLDLQLFPQTYLGVGFPMAVARAGADLWVVAAAQERPQGTSSWLRIGPGGRVRARFDGGEFAGLVGLTDGGVLGLAGAAPARQWIHLDRDGRLVSSTVFPQASHLSCAEGQVALANRGGELWSFPLQRGVGAAVHTQLDAELAGIAPGPERGWWWLGAEGALRSLDGHLLPIWKRQATQGRALLAGDESRAWVIPRKRGWATAWDGDGNRIAAVLVPMPGATAAMLTPGGGVLICTPGALLELDPRGAVVRTQGGFTHLVGIGAPRPE